MKLFKRKNRLHYSLVQKVVPLLERKIFWGFISIITLGIILQTIVFQSEYFQAFAQCVDSNNPRADYLITSQSQGTSNRFFSRIGTCIINKNSSIGEFRQSSYRSLFEEFFQRSKVTNKVTLTGNPTAANFNNMSTGVFWVKKTNASATDGNLNFNTEPTGGPVTAVIFVEGDLYITDTSMTYGNAGNGLVFIVQGSVFFDPNTTQFNGIIIAQGGSNAFSVCTAANFATVPYSCPSSTPVTNPLIVDGSIIALDKPIHFNRKLSVNTQAAEQVNHQVKFLAILNDLLSRTTSIVSENTSFAICSATPTGPGDLKKPIGCSCSNSSDCTSANCSNVAGASGLKTCQPGSGGSGGTGGVISTPNPVSTATPQPIYVPPQLVAFWKMDDPGGQTIRDEIGGNTGTSPNSTVISGRFGLARDLFNNTFITVNDSPAFRSQDMTISAWIYPKTIGTSTAAIFNRSNAVTTSINFKLDGTGGLQCTANGQTASSGTAKLVANTWNHAVCLYSGQDIDSQNIKIYLSVPGTHNSAQKVGNISTPGSLSNPTNATIQIGRNIQTGQTFIGSLDEMRIYSYALGQGELNGLFTQTPSPGTPAATNPWQIFNIEQILDFKKI